MPNPERDEREAAPPAATEPTCPSEHVAGDGKLTRCALSPGHGGDRHKDKDGFTWPARNSAWRRWGRR